MCAKLIYAAFPPCCVKMCGANTECINGESVPDSMCICIPGYTPIPDSNDCESRCLSLSLES